MINEIAETTPPSSYHVHDDFLAQYLVKERKWDIYQRGKWWYTAVFGIVSPRNEADIDINEKLANGEVEKRAFYPSIMEQGGLGDILEENLIKVASGRVNAAIGRGQLIYEDMENSHRKMLAEVLTSILYHRFYLNESIWIM